MFEEIFLRSAKACKSCRSRQELSNEYFLAKFGFDTADNEPDNTPPRDVIFTYVPRPEVPHDQPGSLRALLHDRSADRCSCELPSFIFEEDGQRILREKAQTAAARRIARA